MVRKMLITCITSLLMVGFWAGVVAGQEPARTKAELIKELVVTTGLSKQAGLIVDTMLAGMNDQFPQMMERIAETDPNLTPEQRLSLKTAGSEKVERFTKAFREKIKQRVNFGQIIEEIGSALYDKYFTEAEIKDLIAFYKSPTGQKAISVMPQLVGESMQQSAEKLTATFTNLAIEVLKEVK